MSNVNLPDLHERGVRVPHLDDHGGAAEYGASHILDSWRWLHQWYLAMNMKCPTDLDHGGGSLAGLGVE